MKKSFAIFAVLLFVFCGNFDLKSDIRQIESSICAVAEKSFPAVVVIKIKKSVNVSQNPWDMFFDSPFMEKFRRRFPMERDREMPILQGGGSGFIVDEEGYIITNNHVIQGANEVIVSLNDKSEYAAKIIGTDPKTDIAVLKIDVGRKVPFLEFADSEKVKIGQFCLAIGAPFMFDYTITFGIVSQKGRQVGLNFYENYIQTDAAINMGNSGGPLLNLEGKVIGVNDFIVSGNSISPGNIGLGFAIPSNMAKNVYEQIRKHGQVVRPWVGIGMDELPQKQKLELKIDSGVVVREVYEGHPADKANIEPGDIILKVSGKKVDSPKDVQNIVIEHKPGDVIEFEILKDGKKEIKKVVAERQAKDLTAMLMGEKDENSPNKTATAFGLSFSERDGRVIISEVIENSNVAMLGVEPGMTVLSINGKRIRSVAEAEKILTESKTELSMVLSDGVSKRMFSIKRKN